MPEMLELIGKISLLAGLAVCAWIDWKSRQVYLLIPVIMTVAGLVLHIFEQKQSVIELIAGMLLGGILLFIAVITQESIGSGDAAIFMMTGSYLGFWDNLCLLMGTFMLAGVTALVLLVLKKKTRKERIPVVPYVFVSYMVMLL